MPSKINVPILLITSCVTISDHSVILSKPNDRIHHTIEAITHWIRLAPNLPIVICDGSNFDFSDLLLKRFPNQVIECLFFQNQIEFVIKQGKGYGEGEIVQYALEHSKLIKKTDLFVKCTGKLWVENFDECFNNFQGSFQASAYFKNILSLEKTDLVYIDTRFYISTIDFYKQYLMQAYMYAGLSDGRSIEHVFKDILLEKKISKILFPNHPIICGVGGGHGKYYKNNLKRRLKDRLKLRLIKQDPKFSSLFP